MVVRHEDLVKILVQNRYRPAPPAIGFVRGFGLQRGAMAFLALPVIPALKITDLGLSDGERFALTDLFV